MNGFYKALTNNSTTLWLTTIQIWMTKIKSRETVKKSGLKVKIKIVKKCALIQVSLITEISFIFPFFHKV